MNRLYILLLALILFIGLPSCSTTEPIDNTEPGAPVSAPTTEVSQSGSGMGMGMGGGMHALHHATIPDPYAGMTNPQAADEASLDQGAATYTAYCATCHGDGGMGDGPAGAALDPQPAPIAHTSQMLGDDYLFWRVSEGGHEFSSAMPSWEGVLGEADRWDVINYVRALGTGAVTPGSLMGGATFDPAEEAAKHAEMAATAVSQEVITQAEADTFLTVHGYMDEITATMPSGSSGGMGDRQTELLTMLVKAGTITQDDADAFADIHERLLEAGLMN